MGIVTATESTVRTLLEMDLTIPPYQRPYKWQPWHVQQLLDDLQRHQHKTRYRLGTVVLYRDKETARLAVVDGQQRLLTLTLICHLLNEKCPSAYPRCEPRLLKSKFDHPVTRHHVEQNAALIDMRLQSLDESAKLRMLDFLLERCELVCVQLDELSEAFQLFDSQNARGKPLAAEDLLKAFHLREMRDDSETSRQHCVTRWEAQVRPQDQAPSLQTLIGHRLFPIRRWCRGESGLNFSKKRLNLFKGLSPREHDYRYAAPLWEAYRAVERYNADPVRNWDGQRRDYPFTIDQALLNGRPFFEFIAHYTRLYETLFVQPHAELAQLLAVLDNYEGRYRPGDGYVRKLFECTLLYYFDRFGDIGLQRAAQLCFLWSYRIRLEQGRVVEASIDNAALDKSGFFQAIRKSMHPHEALAHAPPQSVQMATTRVDGLKSEFERLHVEVKQ